MFVTNIAAGAHSSESMDENVTEPVPYDMLVQYQNHPVPSGIGNSYKRI